MTKDDHMNKHVKYFLTGLVAVLCLPLSVIILPLFIMYIIGESICKAME